MEGKFAQWSAENATKAYLKTLKMGVKRAKEPDVSEFISAIAAGNNAQLMVVTCGEATTPSTLLALVAAAHQTGGRVICIFHDVHELQATKQALSLNTDLIEYVIGDAKRLILEEDYKEADFVLIDCNQNHEAILREIMQGNGEEYCKGAIVLGINAFSTRSWQCAGLRTQLLPIGEGLLLTRIGDVNRKGVGSKCGGGSCRRKSHWVVKVDRHTGEEHVFRVRCLNGKEIDGS